MFFFNLTWVILKFFFLSRSHIKGDGFSKLTRIDSDYYQSLVYFFYITKNLTQFMTFRGTPI